jgi:hypothetical protein
MMLQRSARLRPSVNKILQMPLLQSRMRKFLQPLGT